MPCLNMIMSATKISHFRGARSAMDHVLHSHRANSVQSQMLSLNQKLPSCKRFTTLMFAQATDNLAMSKCSSIGSLVDSPVPLLGKNYIRRLHNSASLAASEKFEKHHLLETWNKVVHPFGKLCVKGPLSVFIESLNLHEYPSMNLAFVSLCVKQEHLPQKRNWESVFKFEVNVTDHEKQLNIKAAKTEHSDSTAGNNIPPMECHIQVPIKFGIAVEVGGNSCVSVSDLESSDIRIKSDQGTVVLNNIRAGFLGVESAGGHIYCEGTLQGNVDLKTGLDGEITCQKVQGVDIRGQTYSGRLSAKTIYGDNSAFWTNTGDVYLGSCHGNTSVDVYRGDININSVDGSLAAHVKTSGSVDVHLIRPETVDISTGTGNVNLKLPETVNTSVNLVAKKISIDSGLNGESLKTDEGDRHTTVSGMLGSEESEAATNLRASTSKGEITLHCHDWITSLSKSNNWKK